MIIRFANLFCVVCFPLFAQAVAINISNVSDLDFGMAPQGDPAKTVLPGSSENSSNGSFTVTGDNNRAYTITLPSSATMTTTGSGVLTIAISNFTSFPAVGTGGVLSATGTQSLFIGATRAALNISQQPGSYTGNYTIDVIY